MLQPVLKMSTERMSAFYKQFPVAKRKNNSNFSDSRVLLRLETATNQEYFGITGVFYLIRILHCAVKH
jgi:hypothetical protein